MSNPTATNLSTKHLSLSESIDITCINRIYEELKYSLINSSSITIDAGNVNRIDTAGLQLLCSWYLETKKHGVNVYWQNTAGTFSDSARLLGVADILQI